MVKIYSHVVGNTVGAHEEFLKKLKKRGAKKASTQEDCDVTILFCSIVSRFETDIQSALSSFSGRKDGIILVAMHHTHDPEYPLPDNRQLDKTTVRLFVQCLFHEKEGLLKCAHNKKAKKMVIKELGLRSFSAFPKKKKKGPSQKSKED